MCVVWAPCELWWWCVCEVWEEWEECEEWEVWEVCEILEALLDSDLIRLFSSICVPLFHASEKMEDTTLWERAWLELVPSDKPLSAVTLEWLDWDSGMLAELPADLMEALEREAQSYAASVRFMASW